jgi:hypothetical protein
MMTIPEQIESILKNLEDKKLSEEQTLQLLLALGVHPALAEEMIGAVRDDVLSYIQRADGEGFEP